MKIKFIVLSIVVVSIVIYCARQDDLRCKNYNIEFINNRYERVIEYEYIKSERGVLNEESIFFYLKNDNEILILPSRIDDIKIVNRPEKRVIVKYQSEVLSKLCFDDAFEIDWEYVDTKITLINDAIIYKSSLNF